MLAQNGERLTNPSLHITTTSTIFHYYYRWQHEHPLPLWCMQVKLLNNKSWMSHCCFLLVGELGRTQQWHGWPHTRHHWLHSKWPRRAFWETVEDWRAVVIEAHVGEEKRRQCKEPKRACWGRMGKGGMHRKIQRRGRRVGSRCRHNVEGGPLILMQPKQWEKRTCSRILFGLLLLNLVGLWTGGLVQLQTRCQSSREQEWCSLLWLGLNHLHPSPLNSIQTRTQRTRGESRGKLEIWKAVIKMWLYI